MILKATAKIEMKFYIIKSNYLKKRRKRFRKQGNVKYTNESITKKMGGQSMLLMLKTRLIFIRKLMKKQNLDRIEIKYLPKRKKAGKHSPVWEAPAFNICSLLS